MRLFYVALELVLVELIALRAIRHFGRVDAIFVFTTRIDRVPVVMVRGSLKRRFVVGSIFGIHDLRLQIVIEVVNLPNVQCHIARRLQR
ncbi:hypothetical protein D3C80_1497960 [compost metagenome]